MSNNNSSINFNYTKRKIGKNFDSYIEIHDVKIECGDNFCEWIKISKNNLKVKK